MNFFMVRERIGQIEDSVLQIFSLDVASGAAGGEPAVIPGLVGCQVALLSTELMKAATCELIKFHGVVWFKFRRQIVVIWDRIGGVPACCAMLNNLGFCNGEVGEEITFHVLVEEESFYFNCNYVNR
jgi:hypothetical protein